MGSLKTLSTYVMPSIWRYTPKLFNCLVNSAGEWKRSVSAPKRGSLLTLELELC